MWTWYAPEWSDQDIMVPETSNNFSSGTFPSQDLWYPYQEQWELPPQHHCNTPMHMELQWMMNPEFLPPSKLNSGNCHRKRLRTERDWVPLTSSVLHFEIWIVNLTCSIGERLTIRLRGCTQLYPNECPHIYGIVYQGKNISGTEMSHTNTSENSTPIM